MTTENVDIQVQGTVKTQIESGIRAIGTAATQSYTAIERLQKMLNILDSGGVSTIESSMKRANAEIQKQTRALNDAAASSRMQASNLRVLQQQIDKNTAAQQASAAATSSASDRLLQLAKNGIAATQAQRDQNTSLFEAARAQSAATVEIQRKVQFTQEEIKALQEATRAARDKLAADRAMSSAVTEVNSAQQRTTVGWQDYNTNVNKVGQTSQLARHHLVNLGFQIQDVGVSLASGQNPLTVFIQQGAQVAGIASQAGVGLGRMALAAAALVAPFLPLVAAVGALAAGLKIMSLELTKSSAIEKFSKDLGLTSQQIKKMHGDVVTMTDVFKAFFVTVSEVSGLGDSTKSFFDKLKTQYKDFVNTTIQEFNMIGAASDGAAAVVLNAWKKLPAGFRDVFVAIYNNVAKILEALINVTIAGINQITGAMNKLGNIKIPEIAAMPIARMDASGPAEEGKSAAEAYADAYKSSMEIRTKQFDDFYKKWQQNSVKGAQDRIEKAFDDAGGDKAGESRAAALAKVNLQLDNQIQRMQQLKPIREQQQQFDAIEEQLAGKKITLNESEAASIRSKIAAVQLQKQVTQEMDKVYEEIQGPSDEYAANLSAIDILLKSGFLSQEQYNAKLDSAVEAFNQSVDPLRKYRQELEFQESTFGKNAQQIELLTTRHQIEQEALKNGTALRKADIDALMAQAAAVQYAQGVQEQYNQIYSDTGSTLEQIRQKQDALKIAYDNGTIGMSMYGAQMQTLAVQAAQLRIAMDQAIPGDELTATFGRLLEGYQGMAAGVTTALGDMFVTLQDGFANALAGAIMGTESLGDALRNVAQQAVQQLIASLIKLGIQYAINAALGQTLGAAGVAASVAMGTTTAVAWAPAAAAVSLATLGANAGPASAGILSTNAVSMASAMAGFQSGGYTGNGAVDKVAGLVHAGEYVMTADTVSRFGIGTMDAIQSGNPLPSAGASASGVQMVQAGGSVGTGGSVTVTVINNANGTTATTEQTDNDQGGKDITVTIDSIENALASKVSSGQGPLSNAFQKSYGVQHQTAAR